MPFSIWTMSYTLQTQCRHTTCCSTWTNNTGTCVRYPTKKIDWPLLFKNQLMLKAQKTVPKGIPATHAVWHSAISIWFQFDFNLISIGKRHRTLVFCPILCPIWIVFPRIVRKYLSLPNLSINGQTKRIAISKIYLSTIHWKVRRVQTPPLGIFVKLIYWLRRPEGNTRSAPQLSEISAFVLLSQKSGPPNKIYNFFVANWWGYWSFPNI